MTEGLAHELALFRKALALPTIGYSQVCETDQLRALITRHTELARRILDELDNRPLRGRQGEDYTP